MKNNMQKQMAGILALLLAGAVLMTGCGSQEGAQEEQQTQTESETETQETVDPEQWDQVVAVFGDHELTNAMLSYYYWTGYASFLGYYGQDVQGMLDLYTPLDQQYYDEDTTWQDYFLDNALLSFRQYSAIYDLAQEAKYSLSENALTSLNTLESNLLENAQQTGFETVEEYLKANYGEGSSLETYREFMRQYFTVMEYTYQLKAQFDYTDEEISDYYDEHAETYEAQGVERNDTPMADVRYLTVSLEDDSENTAQAADEVFDSMLAAWEDQEDHSEEAFMALGEEWSEQGVVQNYLSEVYVGGIDLEGFDQWTFSSERKAGDYTVLDTEYGKILLYYVDTLDSPYWYAQASYDMLYEDYNAFLDETIESYSYEEYRDDMVIGEVEGLY